MLNPSTIRFGYRTIRLLVIFAMLLFFGLATYISILIYEQQAALSKTSRYNVAFSAGQGVHELVRFRQRVTSQLAKPSMVLEDEISLRYAILQNRLSLFKSGSFEQFVHENVDTSSAVDMLAEAIARIDGLPAKFRDRGSLQKILKITRPLESKLIQLASAANYFGGQQVSMDQNKLLRLHWVFSAFSIALIICGAAFVALIFLQKNLLLKAMKSIEKSHEEVAYIATHDDLTGLANRVLFQKKLREIMDRRTAISGSVILLCIDLDDFKVINDTLGHPVGDALLVEISLRLRASLPDPILVARTGGDEFLVVSADNLTEQRYQSLAEIAISQFEKPFLLGEHQIVTSASIGVTIANSDKMDPDELMRKGDLALYAAKADGKAVYRMFEPEMEDRLRVRQAVEKSLQSGEYESLFRLEFQPIVSANDQSVVGAEALLRWNCEQHKSVFIPDLISIAEQSGAIIKLGEWILRKACATAGQLSDDLNVAVNVSTHQFDKADFVEVVAKVLGETNFPGSRLTIELTETVMMSNASQVADHINELRKLGISIALDDFGTGYSSLSYLQKFKFDKLKIDRSFVTDIAKSNESMLLVGTIVNMAHALGMTTVAEGVETEDELVVVRASGCSAVQGYYFSRPQRPEHLRDWLVTKQIPKLAA